MRLSSACKKHIATILERDSTKPNTHHQTAGKLYGIRTFPFAVKSGAITAKKGFVGSRCKWLKIYLISSCNISRRRPRRSDESSCAPDTGYSSPLFTRRHSHWQSNTNFRSSAHDQDVHKYTACKCTKIYNQPISRKGISNFN
ncbi:unnamed protein product [Albugo candida]|uniref:Uncharacterized protein n=1 Tax=Albugo candida TaxID=65357 RepID=A0A024GUM4_9STRA|nr:unnamed protein product [Albugo candida]|eukprot:CCI50471.1 unnamed protein product [Albugo candida]